MKKKDFKVGLFYSILFVSIQFLQDYLGMGEITEKSIICRVIIGAGTGFLFAVFMRRTSRIFYKKRSRLLSTYDGEGLLLQDPANQMIDKRVEEGALFLTNNRLIFRTVEGSANENDIVFDLEEISQVRKYKTMGVFYNGISVWGKSGEEYNSVLEEPEKWLKALNIPS